MGRHAQEAGLRVPLDGLEPSDSDYAYFAGLFDGEGSIDVVNGATPRLKISMTDGPTIAWLLATFGGRVYTEKPSGSAVKVAWRWCLIPRVDVATVLGGARPYLITKAQRADAALDVIGFYSSATNSSYKNVSWLLERDERLEKVKSRGWAQRMYEGTTSSGKLAVPVKT